MLHIIYVNLSFLLPKSNMTCPDERGHFVSFAFKLYKIKAILGFTFYAIIILLTLRYILKINFKVTIQ